MEGRIIDAKNGSQDDSYISIVRNLEQTVIELCAFLLKPDTYLMLRHVIENIKTNSKSMFWDSFLSNTNTPFHQLENLRVEITKIRERESDADDREFLEAKKNYEYMEVILKFISGTVYAPMSASRLLLTELVKKSHISLTKNDKALANDIIMEEVKTIFMQEAKKKIAQGPVRVVKEEKTQEKKEKKEEKVEDNQEEEMMLLMDKAEEPKPKSIVKMIGKKNGSGQILSEYSPELFNSIKLVVDLRRKKVDAAIDAETKKKEEEQKETQPIHIAQPQPSSSSGGAMLTRAQTPPMLIPIPLPRQNKEMRHISIELAFSPTVEIAKEKETEMRRRRRLSFDEVLRELAVKQSPPQETSLDTSADAERAPSVGMSYSAI